MPDGTAAPKRKAPRELPKLALPVVNPYLVVVVTGVVCGLIAVVLSIATQRGCETVRGVGSCGGIGLLALLVILAIEIVIGAALMRAFDIPDPTSTAFLGVGIVAVLAMVFFLGSLESVWMFLVLPLLSAASFAVSYWVSTTFVDVPASNR